MRRLVYRIKGRPVLIQVVENEDDLDLFTEWVKRNPVMAYDTETTGLNIYASGFRIRLAQFGTEKEAWVIPVEKGAAYEWFVLCALRFAKRLFMHNAPFDIQGSERCLGANLKELFAKTIDTHVIGKLWDSRAFKDKGPGHKLEELTKELIDPVVADEVKGSIARLAGEMRMSKEEFFRTVPIDHEGYNLYAGMDVILTSMLAQILAKKVPVSARKLIPYEHDLSRVCAEIGRNGFLLDKPYTTDLAERFLQEENYWQIKIEEFTDDDEFQTGSTADVARVLLDLGWDEFEFTTPKKTEPKIKVDDALLNRAADSGIEFAMWIQQAKKAGKWRKTWPESFLSNMDADGRCHANINTLAARTGRMSISGIPAQTLPAKDPLVRNCFIADPGHLICSIDYSNQELRVTAALSNDPTMRKAFRDGLDLHQMTADAAGVIRATGKMANFLTVYGGGYAALMEQGHVDEQTAKKVLKAFYDTYPGVKKLAADLTKEGRNNGYITTDTGRVLIVDRGRAYSAGNYKIQSTSRDITGAAVMRLDKAGFTEYMRLPIHDEVLFNFPVGEATAMAREAADIMFHRINGVDVPTDYKIGGLSWGSLYEKAA